MRNAFGARSDAHAARALRRAARRRVRRRERRVPLACRRGESGQSIQDRGQQVRCRRRTRVRQHHDRVRAGRLEAEFKKYTKTALLILDELGYLPIDKTGADLIFQVISLRYEQGALIITSNRAFKEWPTIFNHDSTLTSAVLDRLLHHADTIIIEGKSFRMKDPGYNGFCGSCSTPFIEPQTSKFSSQLSA